MFHRESVGRYRGVDYRLQRLADMLRGEFGGRRAYFAYRDGLPTGDHFLTLDAFRRAVDNGVV